MNNKTWGRRMMAKSISSLIISTINWLALFALCLYFSGCGFVGKPLTIEGKVVEKNISFDNKSDSYIKIKTQSNELISIKFETSRRLVKLTISGCENFTGKAKHLDDTIQIDNKIIIETFDDSGTIRNAYKLLSVYQQGQKIRPP
jgi:hypothetical protein